jgi:hypothetical protein
MAPAHGTETAADVPIGPGATVRVPDRLVNAWGKVLEVDGDLVRVKIEHSATTKGRIVWYRRVDLHTPTTFRRRRR